MHSLDPNKIELDPWTQKLFYKATGLNSVDKENLLHRLILREIEKMFNESLEFGDLLKNATSNPNTKR